MEKMDSSDGGHRYLIDSGKVCHQTGNYRGIEYGNMQHWN